VGNVVLGLRDLRRVRRDPEDPGALVPQPQDRRQNGEAAPVGSTAALV
jgi:hypothetical protein